MTDPNRDPLETFLALVQARLAQGARTYAGRSFSRDPAALAAEIEEELADVVGWSFILWARVRALRGAVDAAVPPVERLLYRRLAELVDPDAPAPDRPRPLDEGGRILSPGPGGGRRRETPGARRRAIRPRDWSEAELMAALQRLRPEKYCRRPGYVTAVSSPKLTAASSAKLTAPRSAKLTTASSAKLTT